MGLGRARFLGEISLGVGREGCLVFTTRTWLDGAWASRIPSTLSLQPFPSRYRFIES